MFFRKKSRKAKHTNLRLGDGGDRVRDLQIKLGGITISGEFSIQTQQKLRLVQSRLGLEPTGQLDEATAGKLGLK